MKEFLVSLMFTRGKDRRAPLVAEAVIRAESMEDAKKQIEDNDVASFKVLYYGHSFAQQFTPQTKGTEADFDHFLQIASGFSVRENSGENRRD